MVYTVVPRINIDKEECIKRGEFLYNPYNDGLYYDGPHIMPVQLMVAEGLSKVEVTPWFLRLPFILKGWINLDILLREIDLMKMALAGKLLLHASCVNSTLIVGLPNSGKTYQTFKMVSDGGILISEEYTIINKGIASAYRDKARSCFSAKTIKDCGLSMTVRERFQLMLRTIRAKLFPFMFEAVIWKDIEVARIPAKIDKIVYGSTGTEIKNYKQLIILTENEFPFMANDFLQAYALSNGIDIIDIQKKQRALIKEFVNAVYPYSI